MALRLFPRILLCISYCHDPLDMLEQMSPWDYQQVRRALGHGSGFDSPGFNSLRQSILFGSVPPSTFDRLFIPKMQYC